MLNQAIRDWMLCHAKPAAETTKIVTASRLSPTRLTRRRPSSLEECRAFGLLN